MYKDEDSIFVKCSDKLKVLLVVSSVNNDTGWVIKLSEIYRSYESINNNKLHHQ